MGGGSGWPHGHGAARYSWDAIARTRVSAVYGSDTKVAEKRKRKGGKKKKGKKKGGEEKNLGQHTGRDGPATIWPFAPHNIGCASALQRITMHSAKVEKGGKKKGGGREKRREEIKG